MCTENSHTYTQRLIFFVWGNEDSKRQGIPNVIHKPNFTITHTYVVGSKSFRPDIQKPFQMENAVRDIYSTIYGEVNVSAEKCVEMKGDYVEK